MPNPRSLKTGPVLLGQDRKQPRSELLTKDEMLAIEMAGRLYEFICSNIMTDGVAAPSDRAELAAVMHGVQRTIMSQAAARAYPGVFRLLGEPGPGVTAAQDLPDGLRKQEGKGTGDGGTDN